MAGFEYRGQLNGADNPVTLKVPIANSKTVKIGDALQLDAFADGGGCERAAAGTEILGICVGIVNADGIDLDNADPNSYDGTWVTSTSTYTSAADNMTDKEVSALVIVDKGAIWFNDAAGDLAAADILKGFDLADQDQVADQNGSDGAGALRLIKIDPDDTGNVSNGLFIIAESELDPYTQD